MANNLSVDKQITIIAALAEGSSIRAIERMAGVHRDTIMRLGTKVGQGCARIMNEKMRDLPCTDIQLDEIWGFVGKKQRHLKADDDATLGDAWTWVAIDRDSKAVRLTLAFSKKLENFEAAVGLHFASYNFVKRHASIRMTPAMALRVEKDFWTYGEFVERAS